jgi:hypothetical protein
MAIVRCPRCRDEVAVPRGATSRALVRCPLCLEEYLLSEALAGAPPLLVIIGGEVPQAAIETAPVAGHDYQLAAAAFDSPENHWGHAVASSIAPQAPAVRAGRRPRKREPSVALLLLNWVGGGVLGLALAPLVLWWIFKVDPVELGPTVAAYVPWAVPQQFHCSTRNVATDTEPVERPARRRTKKTVAENEPVVEPQAPASNELQSLPELNGPAQSPDGERPTIEAPQLRQRPATPPAAGKKDEPPDENRPPRPPMPDLTDLLP